MVTFALGFLNIVTNNKSYDQGARFFIGIGFAYTVVSIFSDMGSEIGAGFAILIMLGAIFKEGTDIIDWLTQRSKGPTVIQTHKKDTPTVVSGGRVVSGPPPGPTGPVGPGFTGGSN